MEPSRETKREMLERLRNAGVFLMDVSLEPLNKGPLEPHIPGVIQRLRRANPRRIVLAKANVYDKLFTPLVEAGMPVIDERLRFPAQGWQAEFIESFRRALRRKPATPGARSREASMSRR
jgi:hypothetical protein